MLMSALLLMVLVSLLLVARINDARSDLALTSPGAFNYLLQSERNLDAYIDALRAFQDNRDDSEKVAELKKVYRHRFDIVWGGLTVFDINFQLQAEQQQMLELKDYSMAYLEKNEHRMEADYELSDEEIDSLIVGARSISSKNVHIGHQHFILASELGDVWDEKLRRLYQLFWICAGLLILTGGMLLSMLMRSVRRSADLIDASYKTQREMKGLIDELRSGKLENKAKDTFIAAASHDLRQPLHALGLFLGATEKHIENDAGREALSEAKQCSAELNRLFNSLLDLSRLDAGVVEVNKKQFNIDRLLSLMEQEFSALARQKGISFSVGRDLHVIHSDAILLNRILRNLLENAFTHSGATEVSIRCERRANNIRLTIADDGVGIPEAEQSDIFSEYFQLDYPERDRSKGLGLGLSIVKRLCEILEIDISLESAAGQGTMFHLDVPAGKVSSVPSYKSAGALSDSWVAPPGTLVAVIDDDDNVRRGMISMLESFDYEAVAAESAVQMIRILRLRELTPDFLVVDYRLPDNQTGDSAIRQVRAAFDIEFPAMIITGDTSPGRVNEAASSGFELMHKPVEPAELVKRISRHLRVTSQSVARLS